MTPALDTDKPQIAPPRRKKAFRILLAAIVLGTCIVGGLFLWRYLNSYESTDDAQVDGHINAISSRTTGYVIEVRAEDEQIVKAGDVLVRLDPKDSEMALVKAQADLTDAEASLENARLNVPILNTTTESQLSIAKSSRTDSNAVVVSSQRQLSAAEARLASSQAQVREAEANCKKADDDVVRYRLLVEKEELPRQQYDTAVSTAAASLATLDSRKASVLEAQQNISAAQSAVASAEQRVVQAQASIESALTASKQVLASEARAKSAQAQVAQRKALVEQAKLNLSYCTIVAPVSGIVGKKTVELGQNVSAGQQLMAVVALDDIWIVANFKETQLDRVKPGQRVRMSMDAYNRAYTGKIIEVGGASGSRFSVLPPENATGNYVKVVQRIPVRINLDPEQNSDHRLRPGMSVEPKVTLE